MKTTSNILLFFILSFYHTCYAQTDSTDSKMVQVSFIHPIGLYGSTSAQQVNNLSINLLYGVNGGLSGFEFGGIANKNHGPVNGFQIAGLSNNNQSYANGVLIAGLANHVKDSSYSLAVAGLVNHFGRSGGGIQLAGLSNIVEGNYTGIQSAGLRNKTKGNFTGIQMSGLSNYNKGHFNGIQIGGISNINTADFTGLQIGLINRAKKVNGMQIGLINIANEYKFGVPVGLLSIVAKGFNVIDFAYNESVNYNANLKLGVDHFYNIFKFGYMPQKGEYYTYGLGIGSLVNLTEYFKISLDLSTSYVSEKKFTPTIDFLSEAHLNLRYHILNNIGLFAGPSFNLYFGEHNESGNTLLYVPKPLIDETWWYGSGQTQFWMSYNAGISIMF